LAVIASCEDRCFPATNCSVAGAETGRPGLACLPKLQYRSLWPSSSKRRRPQKLGLTKNHRMQERRCCSDSTYAPIPCFCPSRSRPLYARPLAAYLAAATRVSGVSSSRMSNVQLPTRMPRSMVAPDLPFPTRDQDLNGLTKRPSASAAAVAVGGGRRARQW
jgi:hypothetical protein